MSAYYCPQCGIYWPALAAYSPCPVCLEKTNYEHMDEAIPNPEARRLAQAARDTRHREHAAEAERLRKHADFEAWYADREVLAFRAQLDSTAWYSEDAPSTK